MGKGKRNRRRRRRNNHFNNQARFAEFSHQQYIGEILKDEQKRQKQNEYIKNVAVIEQDLLRRTIFVTNVQDLKKPENLEKLKQFMEVKYGPVELCIKGNFEAKQRSQRASHFPPGRVRFKRRQDAEMVFGGKSLKNATAVMIPCPSVGHRGNIRLSPSRSYANMMKEELSGETLSIKVPTLSLGHWIPSFDDMYDTWLKRTVESEEWFEDSSVDTLSHSLEMKINLVQRRIELIADSTGIQEDFIHLMIFGLLEPRSTKEVVSFRFKDLRNYIDLCRDPQSGSLFLLFSLKLPPKIYSEFVHGIEQTRGRKVDFAGVKGTTFGRCLGFKVAVDEAAAHRVLLHEGLQKLQEFGVFRPNLHSIQDAIPLKCVTVSQKGPGCYLRQLEAELQEVQKHDDEIGLVLRALLDSAKSSHYHIWSDRVERKEGFLTLPELLKNRSFINEQEKQAIVMTLEKILDSPGSTKYPNKLFGKLLLDAKEANQGSIPPYCVRIPRLLLSPCQSRLVGISVEMSNRVIRTFAQQHKFKLTSFLRVLVGDEDGQRMFNNEFTDSVESRFREAIINGVNINGKVYQFLAFSSSQLKECGLWMVAPEQTRVRRWTIQDMRRELGDFSGCRTAPKYAARIGQCFSTTVEGQVNERGYNIEKFNYTVVNDIVADESGKVHSDGTGLICKKLMVQLLADIPFAPADLTDVSIIQIRYGGAKGTLTAWDLNVVRKYCPRSAPQGYDILLRESMTKFVAKYSKVEVCAVGSSIPYYLNRNVILLLRVHDVPEKIFLDMQRKMLNDFDRMLHDHDCAVRTLPGLSGPDSTNRSTLLHILACGLSPGAEPFLFSCLHAIRSHHLFSLRKKARIVVKEGAVLMGGLDETGLVPEGCVFLQISERSDDPRQNLRSSKIIRGAVMVTKHPVMHPGDARMLLAVDIQELRQHKNVILFSQHGSRPEPDKMSGSDLDGDEFAVTWDNRLFLRQWNCCSEREREMATTERLQTANFKPMNYDAPSAQNVPTLPEEGSKRSGALVDHFLNHLKADNLGQIAMLWQDYAAEYRADCEQCIRLAELHSIAVDFPKSGVPATIPDGIRSFKLQKAHWREIKGHNRHCKSVIGQLYDDVIQRGDGITRLSQKALAGRETDKYGLILSSLHPGWKMNKTNDVYDEKIPARLGYDGLKDSHKLLNEALENRSLYEEEVLTAMKKYKVRTEGELFTGCIRKYHKLHKKRQHDIAEEVRRQCRTLRSDHRFLFFASVLNLVSHGQTNNHLNGDMVFGSEDNDFKNGYYGRDDNSDVSEEDDNDEEENDVASIESYSDEMLIEAERAATSNEPSLSPWSRSVRTMAFRLAAAYYVSCYHLSFRKKVALFSFPWIVADVITCGLVEEARCRGGVEKKI